MLKDCIIDFWALPLQSTDETYFINLFVGQDSKKIKAKPLTSKKDR